MKLNKLFLAIGFSVSLFACKNDDDSGPAPDPYDVVLSFDQVTLTEMTLWVGGTEASTKGINIESIMNEATYAFFDVDALSNGSVHFIGDSVIVDAAFLSSTSKYPYLFSNDSLFVDFPAFGNIYLGTGDKTELEITMGYMLKSSGTLTNRYYQWNYDPFYYTFHNLIDKHDYNKLSDMAASDSLLIYNQTMRLK